MNDVDGAGTDGTGDDVSGRTLPSRAFFRGVGAIIALAGTIALAGCASPAVEPFTGVVSAAAKTHLTDFAVQDLPSTQSGHCPGNGISCPHMYFELIYTAPAALAPDAACTQFVAFFTSFSTPASYNSEGGTPGPFTTADDVTQFCIAGLTPEQSAGAVGFVQGTTLFDYGANDQIAKSALLKQVDDGSYLLDVYYTREMDWIGFPPGPGAPAPTHISQAQVDAVQSGQSTAPPGENVDDQMWANGLIGLTQEEATRQAKERGFDVRIIDGNGAVGQDDPTANPKRVTMIVVDGIVDNAGIH